MLGTSSAPMFVSASARATAELRISVATLAVSEMMVWRALARSLLTRRTSMFETYQMTDVPFATPAWIQLGVAVIDGSGSMGLPFAEQDGSLNGVLPVRTKAEVVDRVLRAFVNRMKSSRNAPNFRFAFVSFHHAVTEVRQPRDVVDIPATDSYDPTTHGTGGTAIYTGLEAAADLVETFMRVERGGELPTSAVVVVLSDGDEQTDATRTIAAAQRIRDTPNTLLASAFFATKGQAATGEQLLHAIASETRLYERVCTVQQLRAFFQASMTATALGARPVALLEPGD